MGSVVVDAVRAVVDTVSVDRTAFAPGVTVGGSKVHVVCGGRLPVEQFNVISVLYGPFCGATATPCLLLPPAVTVAAVGDTSSAKSVTTTFRSTVGPYAKLLFEAP